MEACLQDGRGVTDGPYALGQGWLLGRSIASEESKRLEKNLLLIDSNSCLEILSSTT